MAAPEFAKSWRTLASAENEPIMGAWGQSPQPGPGAQPLLKIRGNVPEAESFLSIFIYERRGKVKDLKDGSPTCPRRTTSRSHDQPAAPTSGLLVGRWGRPPGLTIPGSASLLHTMINTERCAVGYSTGRKV